MGLRKTLFVAVNIFVLFTGVLFVTGTAQTRKQAKKKPGKTSEVIVHVQRPFAERNEREERERKTPGRSRGRAKRTDDEVQTTGPTPAGKPEITKAIRAGAFNGDVRSLPYEAPVKQERLEREEPAPNPQVYGNPTPAPPSRRGLQTQTVVPSAPAVAAPTPSISFEGLSYNANGNGHPPDTNGDVGPQYYIQTINTSIGIFDKASGTQVTWFGFNTFMSQGHFGNLCDTNNFGDPVVLYDTFEDRWVITDFAFTLDGSGNVTSNSYQCFAVSKTGDPVSGGWNYYYTVDTDFLGDYPKFGIWTDGIYWSANMFGKSSTGSFQYPRVKAMNKAQMYAGAPTVQVLSFNGPSGDFTLMPSNARLQTGTPPTGTPNFFVSTYVYLNALNVYKFHADWSHPSLSSFTGPDIAGTSLWWAQLASANQTAPTPGNKNDELYARAMMQNQYSNIGGVESLWDSHTVGNGNPTSNITATQSSVRYYQVNVTGGTVAASAPQGYTYSPADTIWRYMPSVAVNRQGDMAIGYTTSNATTNPTVSYAGRLAGDPANSITLTEQTLIAGGGAQSGSCGGTCTRWGDYSAMTLDPDGCTFWYTNEYYAATGLDHHTRIGAFAFPSCPLLSNNGGLSGTVTSSATGLPLAGATVSLGSRTTTTDTSGNYSFAPLPQGTYSSASASLAGYSTDTASNLAVADNGTTIKNFVLTPAPDANCLTDTTQADFQTGSINSVDISTTPGSIALSITPPIAVDQKNESVTTSGFAFTSTSWAGQTFTPALSGQLTSVDLDLFCSGCTGTFPDLTVSIRATSAGLPTGTDLASGTITGFNSGAGGFMTATFATPPTLTAGTMYAIVFRASANPSAGTYAYVRSSGNVYSGGSRVTSTNSGSTWTNPTPSYDLGFHTYMVVPQTYIAAGDFTSGLKDSNPTAAGTTTWGAISWNATVPASTTLKFQAAASNDPAGVFSFVGPDGTSATYFTNGGSLAQFNGFRYLKYKAFFTTSDNTQSPVLNDVTVCYTNPRVWIGGVSSDWNDPANWSSSGVPGAGDPAIIPTTGVTNNPLNTTDATVGTVILGSGRIITTGANTLTVSNCSPSAITGYSSTSYIRGNLTRCVSAGSSYVFPVGTNSGYSPATIGNVVGNGTFTVGPSEGSLAGTDPTKTIQRYWALTPSGATQADVTLTYLDTDVPSGANESAFQFVRRSGSLNVLYAPTTSDTATNTFTRTGVNSFSTWTLGVLSAPTAAPLSISGRVRTANGTGISNSIVTMTLPDGTTKTAVTNQFGAYSFDGITSGSLVTLSVSARRYSFSPVSFTINDFVTDYDLVAK